MSTYVSMPNGPEQVANTGIQLKALSAEFGSQASAILGEIESIESGQPWGHDEAGQAFAASYNQVPQGSDKPFSQSLRDELSDAGTPLGKISDAIINAVAEYQLTDADSANAINNT
jgi:hypothetical protein